MAAPLVEKFAGPSGRVVLPDMLEGFLEKLSPDALPVTPKQVATDRGESADADIGMTWRKAFPAILRDRSYGKPIA